MDNPFYELSKTLAEGVMLSEALRKFGIGLTILCVVATILSGPVRAEDLYVNASAKSNGSGSLSSPYWRITDAVVRARVDRKNLVIPQAETITIHVGPGTYIGQFGTPSPSGHNELLPIVLNVPNLVLQGSTVLALDSQGLPTGMTNEAAQTVIQAKDDINSDYMAALVTITRTTDGGTGDNVSVSGLTFNSSNATYSGLVVYRVSGFKVSGNFMRHGQGCVVIRLASGTVIGNYMTGAQFATILLDGGTNLFPASVIITANRLTHGYGEGLIEASPGINAGAANLGLNGLTAVPLLDGTHPDSSTGLGVAITGNDLSGTYSTGLRFYMVPFAPSSLVAHSGNLLTATVTGNTLNNNGWYGLAVDGGFPWTIPTFSGTAYVTLQGNSLGGNMLGPALFSFDAQGDTIEGLFGYGFAQNWQFLITDLDGELTGFDYDNPVNEPLSGAPLNNVLSINGSANILGVKLTPLPK